MATLVFGMNQSLDGYVDHMEMETGPALFRHWTEHVRGLAGSVYGRGMYELMRYWDEDSPEWDAARHAFAAAWRRQPKWVVSRALAEVGPTPRWSATMSRGCARAQGAADGHPPADVPAHSDDATT